MEEDNLEFSADWMGFTQSYLEAKVPGLTALYANGATERNIDAGPETE